MTTDRPRVLLIDVDGTLVDYRCELPDSAAQAVREARKRGHQVFLCTGRSRAEIYPELWDLGIDGLIGGNGSYLEHDGEVVFHQVLAPDVVADALAWMDANDAGFYLECNSGLFASDNFLARAAAAIGDESAEASAMIREAMPALVFDVSRGHDDVNKISFALHRRLDLDALAAAFAGRARIDTWSATGNGPEFGEFGQLGIHKGAAVQRLANRLGVSTDDLIGFGDARPDVELFANCGVSVAMGNADADALAAADLVTGRVDEDGLARAFATLGLV